MIRFAEDAARRRQRDDHRRLNAGSPPRWTSSASTTLRRIQPTVSLRSKLRRRRCWARTSASSPSSASARAGRRNSRTRSSASRAGTLFQYLTTPPDPAVDALDFPVDTWLYGVARVRDKMHALEQSVMLAGAFGRPSRFSTRCNCPIVPDDRWLALEFPPDQILDNDRLLYTAHVRRRRSTRPRGNAVCCSTSGPK